MSWNSRNKNDTGRVSNPFGAAPTFQGSTNPFGSFGQQNPGAFGGKPPASPFATESRLQSGGFQTAQGGKGRSKGQPDSVNPSTQMQDEVVHVNRASNPFAAIGAVAVQPLSRDDAVAQYKSEYLRKKAYPFSCFGLPEETPVLTGDISPAELRWYLSQGNVDVQKALGERSNILNEDFGDFLRAAGGEAPIVIKRAGPYRIPEPDFPTFVPRNQFDILDSAPNVQPSESDLYIFQSRTVPDGSAIPLMPPPLEMR